MKNWILFLAVFFTFTTKAEVVDDVSEHLIKEQLYLIQEGDDAPHQSEDGGIVLSYLPNKACSSIQNDKCDRLTFSYKQSAFSECIKTSPVYWFDELPVNIANTKGVFNVSSITEPTSKNHDYMVFFSPKSNRCYELSWGFNGQNFDKMVGIANQIINTGN